MQRDEWDENMGRLQALLNHYCRARTHAPKPLNEESFGFNADCLAAKNQADHEVSHLHGLVLSIKDCAGNHIAPSRAFCNELTSKVRKNVCFVMKNVHNIICGHPVSDDHPFDADRDFSFSNVLLLLWINTAVDKGSSAVASDKVSAANLLQWKSDSGTLPKRSTKKPKKSTM